MPGLLLGLTDRNEEITLGFKEKIGQTLTSHKPASANQLSTPRQERKENLGNDDEEEETDLDLTGSPLGADFDPHQKWNLSCPDGLEEGASVGVRSGPQYVGVTLSEARAWLSEEREEERWAVTDGHDKDNTIYLGSRVCGENRVMTKVSSYPSDTIKVLSGQLGKVVDIHRVAGAGHRTIKYQARSEMNLVPSLQNEGSSIKVMSNWNKVSSLLECPPVDADTRLKVTVVAGDDKMETRQLWTELQLVAGFVKGLSGEGVTWLGEEDHLDTETIVSDIIDTVRQIGPRSGVTRLETDTLMADNQDLEPFSFKMRQEVDFTDILWSNLHKVQSYQQLTDALKLIFKTIIIEEIRPFIYARNKTSVVRLVTNIVRGSDTVPDLSGSLPLEILIECGLEKLQRDYSHTLLNGELATKESISHFLLLDNFEQAVSKLHHLHLAVDLAVLLETHTKLPANVLRSIMTTALSNPSRDSSLSRTYNFSVPTQALESLLSQNPDEWQVKLYTGKLQILKIKIHKQQNKPFLFKMSKTVVCASQWRQLQGLFNKVLLKTMTRST